MLVVIDVFIYFLGFYIDYLRFLQLKRNGTVSSSLIKHTSDIMLGQSKHFPFSAALLLHDFLVSSFCAVLFIVAFHL